MVLGEISRFHSQGSPSLSSKASAPTLRQGNGTFPISAGAHFLFPPHYVGIVDSKYSLHLYAEGTPLSPLMFY